MWGTENRLWYTGGILPLIKGRSCDVVEPRSRNVYCTLALVQSFLIVPVVHDSSAAVVHLLAALDRGLLLSTPASPRREEMLMMEPPAGSHGQQSPLSSQQPSL